MNHPFIFSEFRKSLGFTQEKFAEKCGTTLRTVQNWEQGAKITPMAMNLFRYIETEMISGENIEVAPTPDAVVLSERVKMLEALLAEKERLINVLMKQAQN